MESVTNVIRIASNSKLKMSPEGDFFRVWTEFLKPVHKLPNREMDVLAAFLKRRYELSSVINNTDLLDKVLMSEDTKKQIKDELGITPKHFQVIMSKLRKNGVIKDGKLFFNLVPTMTKEGVGLMIYFDFNNGQHIKLGRSKSIKET